MKTYEEMIEMAVVAMEAKARRELRIKKIAADITQAYEDVTGVVEYASKYNLFALTSEERILAKQDDGRTRIGLFITTSNGGRLDFNIVTRVSPERERGFYVSVPVRGLYSDDDALVYIDNNQKPFPVPCGNCEAQYDAVADAISEATANKILSAQ
ncbi:TPA: hypothetical protein I8Y21_002251 [Klebsiella oxytoca]|uniref:Uncharacterized protein n=1 Tax=Klebsiella oxytoca TaxID=571 RepID=A0AAN5RDP5_KLEOX|nr:hypothetical protein [Klebsiella oxytoca]